VRGVRALAPPNEGVVDGMGAGFDGG